MAESRLEVLEGVLRAVEFAARVHDGHNRPGSGAPYVTHPIRVCIRVLQNAGALEGERVVIVAQASILHDVLESGAPEIEMRQEFGDEVHRLVRELTFRSRETNSFPRPRLIACAKSLSHEAKVIKLADRLENILDMLEFGGMPRGYWQESSSLVDELKTVSPEMAREVRSLLRKCRPI